MRGVLGMGRSRRRWIEMGRVRAVPVVVGVVVEVEVVFVVLLLWSLVRSYRRTHQRVQANHPKTLQSQSSDCSLSQILVRPHRRGLPPFFGFLCTLKKEWERVRERGREGEMWYLKIK